MRNFFISLLIGSGIFFQPILAQDFEPNYEEAQVPSYTLPDPLLFTNGEKVTGPKQWNNRRQEIFELFEKEVYGKSPEWDGELEAEVLFVNPDFMDGKATRKGIRLHLKRNGQDLPLDLLIFYPNTRQAIPAFLGLNFYGNHTLATDSEVAVPTAWIRNNEAMGSSDNKASETGRGKRIPNWPYEEIISRGYGLVSLYYGELDPDFDDGFQNGVHGLFPEESRNAASWGSVAGWAWGLSRVMDFLETESWVNPQKVAVLGHSRLGKAALWAGAMDKRFALVISNNSGCGGAALSRRQYGETVGRINQSFPHWFAENFNQYNEREMELPIDQHQLLALIAPRPVYVASGVEDRWADPKGEFLSCVAASPVYRLFGLEGMPVATQPAVNHPEMGHIGYHVRSGGHGLLEYDWMQYLDFADLHF
ncbi:alpha/beta hydrolase family protein [Cyclobacterium jeungdonense]|uniref:Acetylxylan esterase n=1 Tax=Cyclobacterium jeungdonense TaxID=708087 RepID=A0ABT8CC60_9BACT|nr:acetylxylan esterase [Cyclobacterium jeungdonense]MDN3690379.1 acetylxylan esterase [Cyclobacterium jeungdonense]